MVDVRTPDVVVGGAPKSGTTSLFMWLSQSPDITPSNKKETNFLVDKESWLYSNEAYLEKGVEGYSRFFGEERNGKLLMEGCAVYLYSETARKFFADKKTKLIFVLREPVSRIKSNYNYFFNVNSGSECIEFEEYVELLFRGGKFSDNEQIESALKHGDYAYYLKKWFSSVGKDRVKVILLDDIKADPYSVVCDLCDWIGIDKGFAKNIKFGVDNASYTAKSKGFHVLAKLMSVFIPEGRIRNKIKNLYISINGKKSGAQYDIEKLAEYYKDKNKELSRLLSLNLKSWVDGGEN